MATLDTSMYGTLKPAEFENPLIAQGRLMQLMAAKDQQAMGALQRQKAERDLAREGRLAQLAQGDPTTFGQRLREAGFLKDAVEYEKNQATVKENEAKASKEQEEAAAKQLANLKEAFKNIPDTGEGYEGFRAQVNAATKGRINLPETFSPALRDRFVMGVDEHIKRQFPQLSFQNVGNAVVGMHPYTGAQQSSTPVGVSPNTVATNQTSMRNTDVMAGVQAQGQFQRQTQPIWDPERGVFVTPPQGSAPGSFTAPGGMSPQGTPGALPPRKDVPANINTAIIENNTALGKVEDALRLVQANKNSFGLQNMAGDTLMQRIDPKGVEARAAVADLGSLKIHDRSGAAVTAAEFPRLRPFIPSANDHPDTVVKKLQNFKKEYEAIQRDLRETYSPQRGFRENPILSRRFRPGEKFDALDPAKQAAVAAAYEDPANHDRLRQAGLIR